MSYAPIKNKTNKNYNEYLPILPSNDVKPTSSSIQLSKPTPTSNSKSSLITPQNLSRTRSSFAPLKEKRIERSNEIPYLPSHSESSNDITMIDVSMSNDNSMKDDNSIDAVSMTSQGVQLTNRSSLYHHDNIISSPIPRSLIYDFDKIKIIEQPYPF